MCFVLSFFPGPQARVLHLFEAKVVLVFLLYTLGFGSRVLWKEDYQGEETGGDLLLSECVLGGVTLRFISRGAGVSSLPPFLLRAIILGGHVSVYPILCGWRQLTVLVGVPSTGPGVLLSFSAAKRMKQDVALLLSGRPLRDRTPPKLPGHMDSAVSAITHRWFGFFGTFFFFPDGPETWWRRNRCSNHRDSILGRHLFKAFRRGGYFFASSLRLVEADARPPPSASLFLVDSFLRVQRVKCVEK